MPWWVCQGPQGVVTCPHLWKACCAASSSWRTPSHHRCKSFVRSPGSKLAGHSKAQQQLACKQSICARSMELCCPRAAQAAPPLGVSVPPWRQPRVHDALQECKSPSSSCTRLRWCRRPSHLASINPGCGGCNSLPSSAYSSTTQLPGLRRGAEAKGAAACAGAGRLTPGAGA